MSRKISGRLYLVAFVITAAIFILGLLLGVIIESKRLQYVDQRAREERINYESVQLQYLYLSAIPEKTGCNAFTATLNNYIEKTEQTRARLETYARESEVHKPEFGLLKREYVISQINYWILAEKTKDLCSTDTTSILFFYSSDCPRCEDQGFVLDYIKKRFGRKVLIFALDAEFIDEQMIPILKQTYNVTSTPTVIVDDETFNDFTGKDALTSIICSNLDEEPEECT
ncbi:MAG: conjugal transfer protein TraF [Candidatus Altiarchaeota archaeon]